MILPIIALTVCFSCVEPSTSIKVRSSSVNKMSELIAHQRNDQRSAVEQDTSDVYFGVGCFWHVQHEFVDAERNILDRNDLDLTSRAGYAGGTKTDDEGRVCYHNPDNVAYYGDLGHGEVVSVTIPDSFANDFFTVYFDLFVNGDRADVGDRGLEYRSLVGIPGGRDSTLYASLASIAESKGLSLQVGVGDDPDNFGMNSVYLMDSLKFPFHQAERYHQFHDDFMSPPYGEDYNNLILEAEEDGRIVDTGCPGGKSPLEKNTSIQSSAKTKTLVVSQAKSSLSGDTLIDIYFGVGCFWHVQHEFVLAERDILDRKDTGLTSRAGYAGGTRTDDEGRVCYHNTFDVADYGKFGHAEAVALTIPTSSVEDFASVYFDLFKDGDRTDKGDRGPEYRSVLGIPNGFANAAYSILDATAKSHGLTLSIGEGNDADTLGKHVVYVMDSLKFPFHQAEVYHQYHNDFKGLPYGKKYNSLAREATKDGRLAHTNCPGDGLSAEASIFSALKSATGNGDAELHKRPLFSIFAVCICCSILAVTVVRRWKNGKDAYELADAMEQSEMKSDAILT